SFADYSRLAGGGLMADQPDKLGGIVIPTPPTIGAFPIQPDFGSGMVTEPVVIVHTFDQPGLKTEQRIILGDGARRFRVRKQHLSCNDYDNLKAHWQQAEGVYAQFPY